MDWLCFGDSEEQDDAEWKQDKEREGDDVSEEGGDDEEQPDEGIDGTKFVVRFSEEAKDKSCNLHRRRD